MLGGIRDVVVGGGISVGRGEVMGYRRMEIRLRESAGGVRVMAGGKGRGLMGRKMGDDRWSRERYECH